MDTAQRYACKFCGTEVFLPESPTNGPYEVRKGCESCGYITTHRAVGRTPIP